MSYLVLPNYSGIEGYIKKIATYSAEIPCTTGNARLFTNQMLHVKL